MGARNERNFGKFLHFSHMSKSLAYLTTCNIRNIRTVFKDNPIFSELVFNKRLENTACELLILMLKTTKMALTLNLNRKWTKLGHNHAYQVRPLPTPKYPI